MKKEMDELFVVYADDTGEPLEYFITNNASKCEDVFSKLEKNYLEDYEDDLHPLNTNIFEETMAKKGVAVKRISVFKHYYF